MFNQIQMSFLVLAMGMGCAMLPLSGHDPSGGKLGGRNPLGAINDVLRSRDQRRVDGECFGTLTRDALIAHRDGCDAGTIGI